MEFNGPKIIADSEGHKITCQQSNFIDNSLKFDTKINELGAEVISASKVYIEREALNNHWLNQN